MNGIASLYQMTPTGVPFRTGMPGESTSEQRYFVPGYSSVPLTPEQLADQEMAAQRRNYGDSGGGFEAAPSPFSQMTPTEQAAYYAENPTMAAVTQLGQNVFGLSTYGQIQNMMDPIGVAQQQTIAQGINPTLATPFGPPGVVTVTPIAPTPTAQLAQMNQQQQEKEPGVPTIAATVAEALSFADTQDAEAGANNAAAAQGPGAMDQGIGGVSEAMGGDPSVGGGFTAASQNVDNMMGADPSTPSGPSDPDGNSNFNKGGRVMNYAEGGETSGRYQYTYNPENQTYTQISGPGMASGVSGASGMTNFGSGLGALIKGHNINQNPTQEDLDKFLSALMRRYSQGGVASLANRVQEKGRGQDTMLVHMTPKEVGGLQALAMAHGGSLSINPRTGLVEAGFLSSILPMVAGAALAATGVGAPMAALMVGGGYGLATGSLSKGLMAGLGAFGGAGLGAGLSAAGATAPAVTGTAPGLAQAGVVAPQAAMSAAPGSFQAALPGLGVSTASSAAAPAAATTFAPAAAPVTFGNMGTGLSNVIQGTEGARGAFMSSVGGPMGLAKYGGAAAAPILAGGFGDQSSGLPIQEQFVRPFRYEPRRQSVPYRTGERGESTAEQAYFDSRFTPVGVYKAGTEPAYGTYAMGGSIEEGVKNGDIRAFDDEYGQDEYYGGGLTALAAGGSPNKPRFLMGKGDGMSDSIPATINDTQPARLADGEFVIPADVVSHLGNGSSKAGAAKLHSMMNRIRKARTGKKRQAPEVRAERYMPA